MKNKLIDTVTFCKRLGKLTVGFDVAKAAMQTGEAQLILLAADLSPKTQKEAEYLCRIFEIPFRKTEITLDEYWYLIGKRAGVIAVTEPGFAEKITAIIDSCDNMDKKSSNKEEAK